MKPTTLAFSLLMSISFSSLSDSPPPFVDDRQAGGKPSDGLQIDAVRHGRQPEYERLVFDVSHWSKSSPNAPAATAGFYTVQKVVNRNALVVEFSGYRGTEVREMQFPADSLYTKLSLLTGEEWGDDSAIFYEVQTKQPPCFRIFGLMEPARVVLDTKPCR